MNNEKDASRIRPIILAATALVFLFRFSPELFKQRAFAEGE